VINESGKVVVQHRMINESGKVASSPAQEVVRSQ
jgi:hypothetical protein